MKILAIIGSATQESSNKKIAQNIAAHFKEIDFEIFDTLQSLPPFETRLTDNNVPEAIVKIRHSIAASDGILFSTPEYIFSIPSGLKNLLEWCVSTMVFDKKPVAIITAAAQGEKAHEELKLILTTLGAEVLEENKLLIAGIKGKFTDGHLNSQTFDEIAATFTHFLDTIQKNKGGQ